MDFPLGSTRTSKFTAMNGPSESPAYIIGPYACLGFPQNIRQAQPLPGIMYSDVSWDAVAGAAGYNIYKAASSIQQRSYFGKVTGTSVRIPLKQFESAVIYVVPVNSAGYECPFKNQFCNIFQGT